MAAAVQAPLPTMLEGGVELIKDTLLQVNEIDPLFDGPSPSTQIAQLISQTPIMDKAQDLAVKPMVKVIELDVPEDEAISLLEFEPEIEDPVQILIDGEPDLEDALVRATELAILEDLEAFEPLPAVVTQYHDNIVHVHTNSKYTLASATYEVEETSITQGQDPCGVCHTGITKQFSGNQGKMEFLCGRKSSHEVAQWWSDKVTNSSAAASHLNFAFTGLLTLELYGESLQEGADKIVLPDFGLAQGYSHGSATWLFGSADGETDASLDTVKCTGWSSAWGNLVQAHFRRPSSQTDLVELLRIEYL